jgi:hypothetical protein
MNGTDLAPVVTREDPFHGMLQSTLERVDAAPLSLDHGP